MSGKDERASPGPAGRSSGQRDAQAEAVAELRDEVVARAHALGAELSNLGAMVATAESCTGGLLAWSLTEAAGSSAWFERGWVTYSNTAKEAELGVPAGTLKSSGAVSEPTARAMAEGAARRSGARLSIAVTGIAGPSGGSPGKPVGTVCFAWSWQPDGGLPVLTSRTHRFDGGRAEVRWRAAAFALAGAAQAIATGGGGTLTA